MFGNVFVGMSTSIHFADVGEFSDIVYFQRGLYSAQSPQVISVIANLLIEFLWFMLCIFLGCLMHKCFVLPCCATEVYISFQLCCNKSSEYSPVDIRLHLE